MAENQLLMDAAHTMDTSLPAGTSMALVNNAVSVKCNSCLARAVLPFHLMRTKPSAI
jgi:hypothetical protein